MRNPQLLGGAAVAALLALPAAPVMADPFFFSTGNPDGRMAAATGADTGLKIEIEAADDFVLSKRTKLTSATFTGLITGTTPTIGQVVVEIYRVFPKDSDVGRTSGPPVFSTPQVPTRVNSPSDSGFDVRSSGPATLSFSTSVLSPSFTASNSVQPGGIHAKPNQTTGGDGAVTGTEVEFSVNFLTPFDLPADHYFFVPQIEVEGGSFLWLSAPKPIVPPGTPFSPDLQAWTRDAFLDPDWLRIGTDIVGGDPAPTFNESFSLTGETVPEPASGAVLLAGLGLGALARRRRQAGR